MTTATPHDPDAATPGDPDASALAAPDPTPGAADAPTPREPHASALAAPDAAPGDPDASALAAPDAATPGGPDAPASGPSRARGVRVVAAALVILGVVAAGLALIQPWRPTPEGPPTEPAASAPATSPTAGATSATPTPSGPCDPVRIEVASLGIAEPLIAQGLDSRGQLNPDPRQTVWYTGSPRPGDAGIAVIAGHVQNTTPDVFWELDRIKVGDPVVVTCADGRALPLRTVRTASVDKQQLTTDATVWGESATPSVVLITCDRNSRVVGRHHVNNFVVWTVPAS